jgi:16S rRNA (guanine527-N7)-methyltransferase
MKVGNSDWSNFLTKHAKGFDIKLDRIQNQLFSIYAIELIKWTQKINITTITDPTGIAIKHFIDSLIPARFIPPEAELLDIGSGGGFPGIPLKVLLPDLSVTLIDASRKKISFLKHVIRTLQLVNINALHVRAEELAHRPNHINRYDVVISRALSSLDSFVRLALPLVADGGVVMAMKGKLEKTELDHLQRYLKVKDMAGPANRPFVISVENYSLPVLISKRSIVTLKHLSQGTNQLNLTPRP